METCDNCGTEYDEMTGASADNGIVSVCVCGGCADDIEQILLDVTAAAGK